MHPLLQTSTHFEHTAGFKRDMKTAKTTALGAIRIEEVRLKRDLG